ncbi:MAG: GGDEF domain-containing phosphodiesterase [Rhodocyclaceae bacterium]|nr:GGDEF domain-containing phosphodiesterase [Rhodocyclaceae bacterium]
MATKSLTGFDDQRVVDHVTGLPRLPAARVDIAQQAKQLAPRRCIGIISFAILPDPTLFRLAPEADRSLRVEITRQLANALRPQDRLYAADHWEWLIILHDLPSGAPLLLGMMKFEALFAHPLPFGVDSFMVLRVVCGGALLPDDGEDPRHLIQSSRIACLSAKRAGSGHATFDPAMEHIDKAQQQLLVELPRALTGAPGLALYLQPQIDLSDGSCIGCEVLLRWQSQSGEQIPPDRTLAAVEHLGLRSTFNRWMLQQAIQSQHRLQAENIAVILSINLSANDLLDPELLDLIKQTLATWDVSPESLLFELTETQMIEDTEQVIDVLRSMRNLGFQLSVDDFGTGYASMSYLQRLPVQEVKIDQSFVRHAEASARDREIIASIVQLAHRLGMLVVAEGVETVETARIVAQLGCDRAQGHLYAPAMPLAEFIVWWRSLAAQR